MLQDDAAHGSPTDAGAVIGTLRRVGLTGHKLALQVGDEEALARQVASEANVEYAPWILKVVSDLVKEACDTLEMDVRLSGGKSSPGVQSVNDAVASMDRSASSSAAPRSEKAVDQLMIVPQKGKMRKLGTSAMGTRRSEDDEEERVLAALIEELEQMRAPVLERIAGTNNPLRTRQALLGKFRPSTVKRYLAYWQGFRRWSASITGGMPMTSENLLNYLMAREEEGMGASVPLSISKAVAWMGKVAGYCKEEWCDNDPLVELMVKDLLRKLESNAPPRKRAPRMLSVFIPALESLVVGEKVNPIIQVGAWIRLVKIWASLRFDDVAHLKQSMLKSYEGKLSGLMRRTKTTGAGKRVKELPLHVSKEAWVKHPDWLTKGMVALGKITGGPSELLVPAGTSIGNPSDDRVMTYQEAVAWSTCVMDTMEAEHGGKLIPDGWSQFWTEHSERATMASCLASIGVPKPERDLLGRWKPEGSDQYVRSYNTVIGRLQARMAEPVQEGRGYTAFDEGAVLEELKDWLVQKRGYPTEAAEGEVEEWKISIGGSFSFEKMVEKGSILNPEQEEVKTGMGNMDGMGAASKGSASVAESSDTSSSTSSSTGGKSQEFKKRKVDKLDKEREPGYIIVYNRIDRGRLHRAGVKGCWMARKRDFKRADLFEERPDPDKYTSRCRVCWPREEDDWSSSDSEDEVEDLSEIGNVEFGRGLGVFHKDPGTASEELWAEG